MDKKVEIWNVLQDGMIVGLHGEIPGIVTLRICIPYLLKTFSEAKDTVILQLHECSLLSMLIWNDRETTSDYKRIEEQESEILEASSDGDCIRVITNVGELHVRYQRLTVTFDNGMQTTYDELLSASNSYWDAWSKSNAK